MPSNPGRARSGGSAPRTKLPLEAVQRGVFAGLLAWAFPGAGHWYVGARGRAAVYCGLVVIAVAMGVVFDGNFPVVDSRTPVISRLEVFGSLALGPAEPGLRTLLYGAPVYGNSDSGKPDSSKAGPLDLRRRRSFAYWSNYGSAYLMAAGLMNLLLILDAWDLAIGRKR